MFLTKDKCLVVLKCSDFPELVYFPPHSQLCFIFCFCLTISKLFLYIN